MIRARNTILAILLIYAASSTHAWTLDLPLFRIDVPGGWTHNIEAGSGDEWGDVVTFRHPDEDGHLKIMSYQATAAVTEERLRSMINVDARVPLDWQHWGDFAGYQYAYEEQGSFYLQWFLVNGNTLLLVTYQGDPTTKGRVAADLDRMIRSLTINPPSAR